MFDPGYHVPVLLNEVILNLFELVADHEECLLVDLTFGGGGHSFAALDKFKNLRVIGFDQDKDAIEHGKKFSESLDLHTRISLVHQNFNQFAHTLSVHPWWNPSKTILILADLGVSSHQFDTAERGFSFRHDGPLDMRMDASLELTAADIVNQFSEEKLAEILFKYGEDPFARRLSKRIVEHRKDVGAIQKTSELEAVIFHAYPKKLRHGRTHPATKTFQALRIAVNAELDALMSLLENFKQLQADKCRLGIITFHSLEDRIVKHFFRDLNKHDKKYRIITKSPIIPTETEIKSNSRSRSAKLRLLELSKLEAYVQKHKEKETF
ncbi:MAG: 16S rRNA (cytosine(1402)-N(4))-methyltransferase [Bdellovibrionales bacterium GWA2_49_15]|nr:MAG: 16S rRNA (cytosine(1402)-N(4))-methyltransferase [Bdellovibrionales bacterium GWA2_49_15]